VIVFMLDERNRTARRLRCFGQSACGESIGVERGEGRLTRGKGKGTTDT
jgi:hypothetical protein